MTGFILADIAGLQLTAEDRDILAHPHIAGLVLFARNYENKTQLKSLTQQIKRLRPHFIISVDQEGGRVQRFICECLKLPSMRHWGELFNEDRAQAESEFTQVIAAMAIELRELGVNFDLLPVLDLDRGLNSVIGERSFSADPLIVTQLASMMIEVLHEQHFPVLGKHFPGHGGVSADSHAELPVDDREFAAIWNEDLQPFKFLCDELDAIMPAHVVFSAVDDLPTTYSSRWLRDILRQKMGFKGLVMSDDLTMAGAAKLGGYVERAAAAHEAGCDLLTICNNRAGIEQCLDDKDLKCQPEAAERLEKFFKKITD